VMTEIGLHDTPAQQPAEHELASQLPSLSA
jgi:hypothetical protein